MTAQRTGGILLYRLQADAPQVLLGRPGSVRPPGRNRGVWTIPRSDPEGTGDPLGAALRAFARDTGHPLSRDGAESLGSTRLRGGRIMVVWALRGDLDPALFTPGNPDPDSPATAVVPSPGSVLERVEWFSLDDARRRIKPRQQVFLERLRSLLPRRHGSDRTAR